jgi:hypothetical protein
VVLDRGKRKRRLRVEISLVRRRKGNRRARLGGFGVVEFYLKPP